jgi:hypothetical protein
VIKSARLMLDKFDEMALITKQTKSFSRVPADLAKCFNTALVQYFSDFEARDKMAEESRWPVFRSSQPSLVSLYFTYFYHSKEEHHPMRTVILSQISQLREKTVTILKTVEKYGQMVLDGFDDELREGKFGMPPIHTSRLETLDADPTFFILRTADLLSTCMSPCPGTTGCTGIRSTLSCSHFHSFSRPSTPRSRISSGCCSGLWTMGARPGSMRALTRARFRAPDGTAASQCSAPRCRPSGGFRI